METAPQSAQCKLARDEHDSDLTDLRVSEDSLVADPTTRNNKGNP